MTPTVEGMHKQHPQLILRDAGMTHLHLTALRHRAPVHEPKEPVMQVRSR